MMKKLLLLGLLLIPTNLYAQTHYCDTTPPTSGNGVVGSSHTIQVCQDGKDSTGTVNLTPTSWTLYVDGAAGTPVTMTKGSTSTVSGKTVYTGSYIVTSGSHSLQMTASFNGAESAKSSPFALTGVNAVPSAPSLLSVQ